MIVTLMNHPAEIAHGPMFVGFLINMFLLGITTLQVYNYLVTFVNDGPWLRMFVISLYLANILNTAFIAAYLYNSLIHNFGDVQNLLVANWVFATDPVLTGTIATMAQLFFAWRVRIITSSNWLALLVVACTLVGLAGAVATTAGVMHYPRFIEFQTFKAAVLVWLVGQCVADVAITLILVEYLRKHKTGFHSSDQLVDRIIRMTVQTGLTTSLCAVADLILYLVNPTGLHLIFNFPLAKLYTVSLMSSLNSRAAVTKGESHELGGSSESSTCRRKQTSSYRRRLERPEVFIEVESHSQFEDRTLNGNEDGAKLKGEAAG